MDSAFPNETRRPDGSRGFRGTSENAKTRLCTRWLQGDCRFGERCNFAHGEAELRKSGERPDSGPGGYGGRGGGRVGGGYPARGMGMGPGGYGPGPGPAPGRGRGMYGDMGYGGGYGGGYGMPPAGYGAPMEHGRPPHMPEDVWAAQGFPVAGPNGWYMYRTKETGEPYYHNHRTNQTMWERPADWPLAGPGQM